MRDVILNEVRNKWQQLQSNTKQFDTTQYVTIQYNTT